MASRVVEGISRLIGRVDRAPEMAALRLGEQLGLDPKLTSKHPSALGGRGAITPPLENGFVLPFTTEDLSRRLFNG